MLWKHETPKGNYKEEYFKAGSLKKNLLLNYALRDRFETVIFNDRKIKHEVWHSKETRQKVLKCPPSDLSQVVLAILGSIYGCA